MKRLAALALALIALPTVPAQATKTNVRFKAVGKGVGPAATGERYAAYPLGADTLRLLDPVTGGRLDVDQQPGCDMAALSGRYLLWNCFRPLSVARVLDIETGIVREPEVAPGTDTSRLFAAIGSRWIGGTATGPGYSDASFYLDWRTGQRRSASSLGAGSYPDLDSASLVRRLCTPLRRPRSGSYDPDNSDVFGDPFDGYQYERPFGLRTMFDGDQFFLELDRCGRRARQSVARRPFASENLLAGKITFAKPGSVNALLPRSGRTFKWSVRSIDRVGERSADIAHTAQRIFVSVPAKEGAPGGPVWRIYSAPWPK